MLLQLLCSKTVIGGGAEFASAKFQGVACCCCRCVATFSSGAAVLLRPMMVLCPGCRCMQQTEWRTLQQYVHTCAYGRNDVSCIQPHERAIQTRILSTRAPGRTALGAAVRRTLQSGSRKQGSGKTRYYPQRRGKSASSCYSSSSISARPLLLC